MAEQQDKYEAILIFGPPGVGKGSQAKLLGEDEKYFHFSTGDMFRALKENPEMASSDMGIEVRELIDKGHFVPDNLTMDLFTKTLQEYTREGQYTPSKQTLILDGIPRNPAQVDLIDPLVHIRKVIYLFSDDETLIQRLKLRAEKEGRVDDKDEEIIRKRLETYKKDTEAVLDKYDSSLIEKVESKGIGTMKEIDTEIKRRITNW